MFLTLDSISYQMIQEVTFNYRLLNSTIHIYTSNKVLDFSSWNHGQIRSILTYTQKAMREIANNKFKDTTVSEIPYNVAEVETLGVPEMDLNEVPTLPEPFTPAVNAEIPSEEFVEPSSINTLPVSPADLKISPNPAYRVQSLGQRHYARRYF
jgi:hypothetical protein